MADLAGANGQRTEFEVVGKRNVPGKLSYNIATGKAKFGIDATASNMLHAKFLRSPYANAIVKSVDISKATGVRLNSNMFDYRKPTILDIGATEMDLLETRAGNAAYGASGISHSLANTHIIICAIQNAIGKWVDPPATPDKILKALGKA
jgi:CO/xanthine dehydrogenase Mo-binding subunit